MVAIRAAVRRELENFSAGELILVACSGGADSLALAFAISREAPKLALRTIALTIDHQLQSGSAEQASKVGEQCLSFGINEVKFHQVKVEVIDGMEASARRARYGALDKVSQEYGAAAIFLGHTRDDQAETVLLGLARGSGTRSLAGMAPQNGKYLRPLLQVTRSQTVAACQEEKIIFWEDPHNVDPRYLRVRVRHELLPHLEEVIGPGVAAALARSAQILRDDADALDSWADREFQGMDWRSLEIQRLAQMPRALRSRLIRRAIYATGAPPGSISAEHVSAIEAFFSDWRGQGEVSLPGGVKVSRKSGRLSLSTPTR